MSFSKSFGSVCCITGRSPGVRSCDSPFAAPINEIYFFALARLILRGLGQAQSLHKEDP